jgi:uncharacterized protein (DUF1778 family)
MPRGRTPKPEGMRKDATLNARISMATRELLEKAAAASGQSVSEEVESRLLASFAKASWGLSETQAVAMSFCRIADLVEAETNAHFLRDSFTFGHIVSGFNAFLEEMRPEGDGKPPPDFPMALTKLEEDHPELYSRLVTKAQREALATSPLGERAAEIVLVAIKDEVLSGAAARQMAKKQVAESPAELPPAPTGMRSVPEPDDPNDTINAELRRLLGDKIRKSGAELHQFFREIYRRQG